MRKETREEGGSLIRKHHEQLCKGLGGRKLIPNFDGRDIILSEQW